MSEQLTLDQARQSRDTAIARVDQAADAEWKDTAARAVAYLARTRASFIADDVWDVLAEHYPHLQPAEPRAIGPVMKNAVRDGLVKLARCEHCGTTKVMRPGRRAHGNATDVPLYLSLIHAGRVVA